MKFLAVIFATLAILPQAIKAFASWFYGFNKCAVGAEKCLVNGVDQGHLMGLLYKPNFFNTTGLWIGLGGMAIAFAGMFVQKMINDRQTNDVIDKAEAHRAPRGGGGQRGRGGMPRPGYMDEGRTRRPAGQRDGYDGRGRDRYNDRYDDEYDHEARYEGRSRRRDYDDDDYDDRPRGRRR